jgi:hypothetical protein
LVEEEADEKSKWMKRRDEGGGMKRRDEEEG